MPTFPRIKICKTIADARLGNRIAAIITSATKSDSPPAPDRPPNLSAAYRTGDQATSSRTLYRPEPVWAKQKLRRWPATYNAGTTTFRTLRISQFPYHLTRTRRSVEPKPRRSREYVVLYIEGDRAAWILGAKVQPLQNPVRMENGPTVELPYKPVKRLVKDNRFISKITAQICEQNGIWSKTIEEWVSGLPFNLPGCYSRLGPS
jgi:hypothetical protein